MAENLSPLEIKLELNNPENKKIVQDYNKFNIGKIRKIVYPSLAKKYPSLKSYLTSNKDDDPIAQLEEAKSQISSLQAIKRLGYIVDAVKDFTKDKEDKDYKFIKNFIEHTDSFAENASTLISLQEKFYVDLIHAVKDVSSKRKISLDKVIKKQQYMDEVERTVNPTRKESEAYLRTLQLYEKEILNISKGFSIFAKKAEKMGLKSDAIAKIKGLPDSREMNAYQKAIRDYNAKEFDRIYSKN